MPGHPGLTYLDLIRQVAPDLAKNDDDGHVEGRLAHPPRHVAGPDFEGEAPDPVTVGFNEDQRIRVGGKPRMALLVDLGQDPERVENMALLMLFDDGPHPKLLDAADVGVDKETSFTDGGPVLHLGPGDDALVTYSGHDDADLTFGAYLVVSTIGDHLGLVTLVRMVSLKFCGLEQHRGRRTIHHPARSRPSLPPDRRSRSARCSSTPTDGDCGPGMIPKAGSHTFRATYRWNAAAHRFETSSEELKTLEYRSTT